MMIYTITFNPAVDYIIHTNNIKKGTVNRTESERICFGGKGINVSLVLAELGIRSKTLGFVAGFTGAAIEKAVSESGAEPDFIHLENGFSRINIKIKSEQETEINGSGPEIPPDKTDELFRKIDEIQDGDTIVLAGSVPSSIPSEIYGMILERLSGKKIRAVADAENKLLMSVLKYRPFLIKPNISELCGIFKTEIRTTNEIIKYAGKLQEMGAVNVLVSRAGDGAVLLDENGRTHISGVCRGTVKNSVGAGDSMVAGFIAGLEKGDYEYALKLGTATGGAAAFSDGTPVKNDILRLLEQL